MPIGLVAGALALVLIAIVFKRRNPAITARHACILALAFAVPVILVGVFDWIHFYNGVLFPAIRTKMLLSGALLLILGAGVILGGEAKPRLPLLAVIYALAFATVVALGYFGASIVYGDAATVASVGGGIGASEREVKAAGQAAAPRSEGETLFAADCAACHRGGGNTIVASLPIRGSKRLVDLETFESFLRAPTMPNGKTGDMPPFPEDGLGDAQVRALYGFVRASFQK
jgi:mono/diheme cytochrome c family protein